MTLDDQLKAALLHESGRGPAPDLDVSSVIRGGRIRRRNRTVRRTVVGVACAAVAFAVLLGGLAGRGVHPAPVERPHTVRTVEHLKTGAAPAIPYCSSGKIHGLIGKDCATMVHRGNTTIVQSEDGVALLDGSRFLRLDRRTPSGWVPVLSQDGRYAAWVAQAEGTNGDLLVFDGRTGRRLARVHLPTAQAWVPGIDDRGRVYVYSFETGAPGTNDVADGAHPMWMYDLSIHRLLEITGRPLPGDAVHYVTSDGFGVANSEISASRRLPTSVVGTVDDSGHWTADRTIPVGWGAWSPDRSRVVEETGDGSWVVHSPDSSRPTATLRLPSVGRPIALPVWETADTVLLTFDPAATGLMVRDTSQGFDVPDAETYVLRCSARSGACEVALKPGYADNLAGPLYR